VRDRVVDMANFQFTGFYGFPDKTNNFQNVALDADIFCVCRISDVSLT